MDLDWHGEEVRTVAEIQTDIDMVNRNAEHKLNCVCGNKMNDAECVKIHTEGISVHEYTITFLENELFDAQHPFEDPPDGEFNENV